ncbi:MULTISPECIES: L,D-transpeptidase family protein [unclassified Novosphingobium]|uniref:L,D-transpeptidase family protein n=1 Tax=unclassified Novosphingobium TaxID=2644732 RepID=UPI0025D5833D|nr:MULTISPECIES: L,D-transpeptidase family protein [unclassified Novosphingobium]HQS70702.1 L,D-transpeptidase family protein [Novosphingobium sp.]
MKRFASAIGACVVLLLGAMALVSGWLPFGNGERAQAQVSVPAGLMIQPQVAPVTKPAGAPPVSDVLQSGVLIVVSKPTQQMFVFKDGALWATSPVSTGKRGHGTPAGVFPILQKRVHHRSNLYSNAPMPFMQRLTWRGIAIHAGRLPGYPASHGCIRLPYGFAKSLFALTRADSTTVVITNEAVRSEDTAITLALNTQAPRAIVPGLPTPPKAALAVAPVPAQPAMPQATGPGQTIQLAAALSATEAEAHWRDLVSLHPELATFRKVVIPAVVGSRQYYRLRASAPGAHAYCTTLRRAGEDCFRVS